MKKILLLSMTAVMLFSCGEKSNKTQEIGERFFEIYSKRKEVDKMVSFYSEDFHYTNVAFESETNDSKFLYKEFYGWADPNFKFESEISVIVDEIVSTDSTIVARGKTLPYSYKGKVVEGNNFVIWLDLDEDLKIKRQTDWFDYPMSEIIEAWHLKSSFEIE